jgi:hypothetical protein
MAGRMTDLPLKKIILMNKIDKFDIDLVVK